MHILALILLLILFVIALIVIKYIIEAMVLAIVVGIILAVIILVISLRIYRKVQFAISKNKNMSIEIKGDIKIMRNCFKVLKSSKNIGEVVNQYNELHFALMRLSKYENIPDVKFLAELPSVILKRIKIERTVIMNHAINRTYNKIIKESKKLKTEQEKQDMKVSFFSKLDKNKDCFSNESLDYINILKTSSKLSKSPLGR